MQKQIQRVKIADCYRPYRRTTDFVTAPTKPGVGYYVAIAIMLVSVFCVAYSLF